MPIKYYYDLMSQPCRAIYIYLKSANIAFESKLVALRKGEHKTEAYAKINPLQKVPVIDDNGFILTESVAILKYLSTKYGTHDPWYPKDLQARAKVDEFCAWQHMNSRYKSAALFVSEVLLRSSPDRLERLTNDVESMLNDLETMFLKGQKFLTGDKITIADLLGVCELMQLETTGRDILSKRPGVHSWIDRVRSTTNPYFDEAHVFIYRLKAKNEKAKL